MTTNLGFNFGDDFEFELSASESEAKDASARSVKVLDLMPTVKKNEVTI